MAGANSAEFFESPACDSPREFAQKRASLRRVPIPQSPRDGSCPTNREWTDPMAIPSDHRLARQSGETAAGRSHGPGAVLADQQHDLLGDPAVAEFVRGQNGSRISRRRECGGGAETDLVQTPQFDQVEDY